MPELRLSNAPSQAELREYGATHLLELDFSALLVEWINMSQNERRSRTLAKRLIAAVEDYCHERGHVIRFKPPKSASDSEVNYSRASKRLNELPHGDSPAIPSRRMLSGGMQSRRNGPTMRRYVAGDT